MANYEAHFIKDAIKRPGALTARVGGKPSKNKSKVKKLAKQGGLAGEQARFYENVLAKANH